MTASIPSPAADLRTTVIAAFTHQFGITPAYVARAPGRVNIIGEHTDYNDGFVLPAAIEQGISIAGRSRDDRTCVIESLDYHGVVTFTLDQLQDETLPAWSKYFRGVMWVMQQAGYSLHGINLTVGGNMPTGGGFSSSAAVEVVMMEILCALHGWQLSQREKALFGVKVEHQFIGVRTGVMDQMISALGQAGNALLLDCRSLEARPVPIPAGVTLLALDTNKRRELVHSEYGTRRAQCEAAAQILGVTALRDITAPQLQARSSEFSEVVLRRATHVVNENARTLAAVEALTMGELPTVGRLINESHTSLSQLYEVSIPELDIMAAIAQAQPGCYGARMMGGGFGGAVIALVADEAVERLTTAAAEQYYAQTGLVATIHKTKAGPGSSVEALV